MDVISLSQALIKFNTINPPGNEEEIAKYIGAILHKEGFAVDYPKYAEGRLNVIATKGLSKKIAPIVLAGHIDVVPFGAAAWKTNPLDATIIVGESTSNMPYIVHKGGLYLTATTTGITAHSSMPELGNNAIYKAARAIT